MDHARRSEMAPGLKKSRYGGAIMGTFVIDVDEFTWICGLEDDPEDLCLHGHVTVQIGKTVMEYDGTVSATALYLLKTLTETNYNKSSSIK